MTKAEQYQRGIAISTRFLELNGMPVPVYEDLEGTRDAKVLRRLGACGYYRPHEGVRVVPSRCAAIAGPAMSRLWSFPGYKVDRTARGVAAHETGHHVDYLLKYVSSRLPREFVVRRRITSYEPNTSETWAETMRLFILNPSLLEEGSPDRFNFVRNVIGLKRLTKKHWSVKLEAESAPPRIIAAAAKWASAGH